VFVRADRAKYGKVILQFGIASRDAAQPATDAWPEAKTASAQLVPTAHRSSSIANISAGAGQTSVLLLGAKPRNVYPLFSCHHN
jgi:hypothetical protein